MSFAIWEACGPVALISFLIAAGLLASSMMLWLWPLYEVTHAQLWLAVHLQLLLPRSPRHRAPKRAQTGLLRGRKTTPSATQPAPLQAAA